MTLFSLVLGASLAQASAGGGTEVAGQSERAGTEVAGQSERAGTEAAVEAPAGATARASAATASAITAAATMAPAITAAATMAPATTAPATMAPATMAPATMAPATTAAATTAAATTAAATTAAASTADRRSALLQPRSPGQALALGLVVGFGTGSFYAGEPRAGVTFSAVDAVLALGFAGLTIALNQEVVHNDFATGRSLKHDERAMTSREKGLYAGSWVAGGLWAASHVVQGVLALRSARRTNSLLEGFSLAPVAGGAGAAVELAF